jgi:outer membrane lipoprotein carrier protein
MPNTKWGIRSWTCLLAILLTCSLPLASVPSPAAPAGSETPEEFVRHFESSYRRVRTLRAEFTQTYQMGDRTRTESGTVYFARGGLMRWDYQEPKKKLFLSTGKVLVLYIPEEKQLTRSPLKGSEDVRVPFRLLLSRMDLRRVFSRIAFADDAMQHNPANRVLRAIPKRGYEEDYSEVLMEVTAEFDIRQLQVIYPDRSKMEFRFADITRNAALSGSLFQFTPPPGTEVIEER